MASAFTHAFTGVAIGVAAYARPMPKRFWVLVALTGILPDADSIGHMLGVEYASLCGHRGLMHSLLFAAFAGAAIPTIFFRDRRVLSREWWVLVLCFFLAAASHGVLDAMTTGGLGVAFFSPFDTTRYFLPWRPIRVSPIGVGSFFSEWGVRVILSELLWVWLPVSVVLFGIIRLRRKMRDELRAK